MKSFIYCLIEANFSVVLEVRRYEKLVIVSKQTYSLQEAGN